MAGKSFWLIVALVSFQLATGAFAALPDVRLPEWHRLKIQVKAWNPKTREITVGVDWQAYSTPLRDITVKVVWPDGFQSTSTQAAKAVLDPEKSWESLHKAISPDHFDGWLEIAAYGRPDQAGLRKQVEGIATYSPPIRQILLNEIDSLKEAIPLGRNVPLHLDSTQAVCLPREMVFSPMLSVQGRPLYFWLPNVVMGQGALSLAFNGFKKGIQGSNIDKALSELEKLEQQLALASEPVALNNGKGGEIFVQPSTLREALKVNRFCLQGLRTPQIAVSGLESLAMATKSGFIEGFYQVNIGTLLFSMGKKAEAKSWYQKGLGVFPAWPLVENWLSEIP